MVYVIGLDWEGEELESVPLWSTLNQYLVNGASPAPIYIPLLLINSTGVSPHC